MARLATHEQAERRRIMAEERRMRTYHDQAMSALDDDRGGRYGGAGSKATVTGSSPIHYPAQPEGSPWRRDECPPEPCLGYSVEAQEPVGEMFERSPPATPVDAGVGTPPSPSGHVFTSGGDVRRVRPRMIRRM